MLGFNNIGIDNNTVKVRRLNKTNINFTSNKLVKGDTETLTHLAEEVKNAGINLYCAPHGKIRKKDAIPKKVRKVFGFKLEKFDPKQDFYKIWNFLTNETIKKVYVIGNKKSMELMHGEEPFTLNFRKSSLLTSPHILNSEKVLRKAEEINQEKGIEAKKEFLRRIFE